MTHGFDQLESRYAKQLKKAPPTVHINIEPTKATFYGQDIDRLMREALKDNPIDDLVTLMLQRYEIEQSIKKLLPKMTKDDMSEVCHTLYRIAQKVNERES